MKKVAIKKNYLPVVIFPISFFFFFLYSMNDSNLATCNMLILAYSFRLFNFRFILAEILTKVYSLSLLNKKVATNEISHCCPLLFNDE